MSGVRIVSVGHSDLTTMLPAHALVRVYRDQTVALVDGGLRRLTVVNGDVRDEPVTESREFNRLMGLFDEVE